MAVDIATSISGGVVNLSTGSLTSDGTAVTVTVGFIPRIVEVINLTDVILWKKVEAMTSANTLKVVTAGTTTIDTASAIVINADNTFTISATAAGTAKSLIWIAHG